MCITLYKENWAEIIKRNENISENNRQLMKGLMVRKAKNKMNFLYSSHLWLGF